MYLVEYLSYGLPETSSFILRLCEQRLQVSQVHMRHCFSLRSPHMLLYTQKERENISESGAPFLESAFLCFSKKQPTLMFLNTM